MSPWPPVGRAGTSTLPRLRFGLALCVIAHATAMRWVVGPCDALAGGALVVFPVLAVQGLAALVSLARGAVALVRRDVRSALVELAVALLMLAVVPLAFVANAAMTPECEADDSR